jgi:hypothetical protein
MANNWENGQVNDSGIDNSIPDTPVRSFDSTTTPSYQPTTEPENSGPSATPLVAPDEDFINRKWRPMMAWVYMAICACDFIIFPVLWSILQAAQGGMVDDQWAPITLEGGGLIHVAMGAVLGIAAYGRTKEKLNERL